MWPKNATENPENPQRWHPKPDQKEVRGDPLEGREVTRRKDSF